MSYQTTPRQPTIATAVTLLLIGGTAAAVDQHWHQWHCVNSVRTDQRVRVGEDSYGIAEYSWRHLMPGSASLPDPRDVRLFLGPAGSFQLSRLIVWVGALCLGVSVTTRHVGQPER